MDRDNQPQNQPSPEQEPWRRPDDNLQSDEQPLQPAESPTPTPQSNWQAGEAEPQTAPLSGQQTPAPSVTPEPSQPDMAAQMPPQPTPQKGKKGLIAIIIAAALVVLGGGGALAYNLWYQNPDKVVSDSLMNALQAKSLTYKATVNYDSKDTPGSMTINGTYKTGTGSVDADMTVTSQGDEYKISGSGLFDDKGDLYLKVKNLDTIIDQLAGSQKSDATIKKIFDEFTDKINDKWIKISSDGLKDFSDSLAKQQKCVQDTFKKIQEDQNLSSELTDLYKQHKFLVVKDELGSKDGSLGYVIESDDKAATEFAKGLKETQAYKSLHDCDDNFTINEEDLKPEEKDSDTENTRVELWVSRWNHEITKLNITGEDSKDSSKTSIVFEPKFNQPVNVTAPKDSISTEEVSEAFQELQMQIFQYRLQQAGTNPSLFSTPSTTL